MADFLNAAIGCLGLASLLALIVGHEDALGLFLWALIFAILRFVVWAVKCVGGKVRRKWINTKSRRLSKPRQ